MCYVQIRTAIILEDDTSARHRVLVRVLVQAGTAVLVQVPRGPIAGTMAPLVPYGGGRILWPSAAAAVAAANKAYYISSSLPGSSCQPAKPAVPLEYSTRTVL